MSFPYAVEYFVEGHRFNIIEDIGCYPATYLTPLAFVLLLCWPLAIGVVSTVYGCKCLIQIHLAARFQSIFYLPGLIIHACTTRYAGIRTSVVSSPHNSRHYYRLSALSATIFICSIPASSYILASNTRHIMPWKGWADDHFDFSRVEQFTSVEWRMDASGGICLQVSRFLTIICAMLFFAFFGLAEEVRSLYRNGFVALVKKAGKVTTWIREACLKHKRPCALSSPYQEKGDPILPVSNQNKLILRHHLMASFSPNRSFSNLEFGASGFTTTLADKQDSYSSIEVSSDVGTLPPTPSSDRSGPPDSSMPLSPVLARPEPAYVDSKKSGS